MDMLRERGHSGAITHPRLEKLWTFSDPLRYRRNHRYEFEMEIFDLHTFKAHINVRVGKTRSSGPTVYYDGATVGGCAHEVIQRAKRKMEDLEGANVDISVVVDHGITPGFFAETMTPSFYRGDVMVFTAPNSWWRQDDENRHLGSSKSMVIWENGAPAEGASDFDALIAMLSDQDAVPARRSAPLRFCKPIMEMSKSLKE